MNGSPICYCGATIIYVDDEGERCSAGHWSARDSADRLRSDTRGHNGTANGAASVAVAPKPRASTTSPVLTLLCSVEARAVSWLWPGRIPLGKVTVLDGDPGLGKSLLSLDLAARVTTGRAMPDGQRSDLNAPAGVVLLSAEDDLGDTIRPRLEAAGAAIGRVVALTAIVRQEYDASGEPLPVREDVPTLATDGLEAIEEGVRRVTARLVVIDPLMAYLDSKTDAHRDQDVRRALAPLAQLAERTGAAVLVIRHLNKMAGSNPLYRGGGSIGIIGAARSGLLVAQDPDNPARRLLAGTKANLATLAPTLAYSVRVTEDLAAHVVWHGENAHTADQLLAVPADPSDRATLADAADWLRDRLAGGPVAVKDLQEESGHAGHTWPTVRRAKAGLNLRTVKTGFGAGAGAAWRWIMPEQTSELPKALNREQDQAPAEAESRGELPAVTPESASSGQTDSLRCSNPCTHGFEHLRLDGRLLDGNDRPATAHPDAILPEQTSELPKALNRDIDHLRLDGRLVDPGPAASTESTARPCPVCGTSKTWWAQGPGTFLCATCHPDPHAPRPGD
ncbi:MAG TPA: AAA family ATPase [Chloroflexota bacterium]|nr:AAA family ATPase [Chloroflexota bacterium]